jgi:hypothetical protein
MDTAAHAERLDVILEELARIRLLLGRRKLEADIAAKQSENDHHLDFSALPNELDRVFHKLELIECRLDVLASRHSLPPNVA